MPAQTAICIGLATLDVIQAVDALPTPNAKAVAQDFVVAAGGPAANAAVACAHLRTPTTLVTALPAHPLAEVINADLVAHGVDVQVAATYAGPPITASILVTAATGERAIVSPSGVATLGNPPPTAALPSLNGVGALLIDGYFRALAAPLVAQARSRGIPVILDGGSFKAHTPEVARWADIAVVSEDFAVPAGRADGGAAASRDPAAVVAWFAELGVASVVITRGGDPLLYSTPVGRGEVPPPRVDVVDTLGAGDVFHGALLHRITALGWDHGRLPADLAAAATVAARSVTSFGTRAWLAN